MGPPFICPAFVSSQSNTLILAFHHAGENRVLAGSRRGAHPGTHAARARHAVWPVPSPSLLFHALGRLRRVGERNLELALPQLPQSQRRSILRGVYRHLGWQLVEFCRMPRYTPQNTRDWIRTEGLDHYLARMQSRQRRLHPHRPPWRMGALQLLPLAHGLSHGHGHPPPR